MNRLDPSTPVLKKHSGANLSWGLTLIGFSTLNYVSLPHFSPVSLFTVK